MIDSLRSPASVAWKLFPTGDSHLPHIRDRTERADWKGNSGESHHRGIELGENTRGSTYIQREPVPETTFKSQPPSSYGFALIPRSLRADWKGRITLSKLR